ncbi:TetR/AcrR family transcriptional regulator [Streptosporangiaceae bacterium NEAU-GS5]|nr:TetR/AcrR family transcriptional regulator [Streptosporangiaceae bacterium NEAU-GS5]
MRTDGKRAATTDATRRAIITAARDLLAERRWQRFTVDAVAKRAGVTRVTVYNQARSKRGLLEAVLTDLTERARMDQLLNDTRHLDATEACAAIILRTCRFWHAERDILRPLFGLAGVDHEVAALLGQREQWREDQLRHLLRRLGDETTFTAADTLAATLALTSFPTYDSLGELADDPDRAAQLINHLVRSLTT